MEPDTIIYYKPGCSYSTMLRVKMRLARIPYQAVRFGVDPVADAAVRAVNAGNEISPTVYIRGTYLTNPSLEQVQRALADT